MIVALDDETEALHKPDLREGGIFLSREMTKEIGEESKKLFGEIRSANTVLVGMRSGRHRRNAGEDGGGGRTGESGIPEEGG